MDVEIARKIDPAAIGPFENADATDGILLNHDYVDMRGFSISEAQEVVAEKAGLLREIGAIGADDERVEALKDRLCEAASQLSGFDVGTAGAIFALSTAGAAPISSCNGGLLGDESHASQVPHILFSVERDKLGPIFAAAEGVDVGLLNNSGHIEVFAECIPKLNAFAAQLLIELEKRVIGGFDEAEEVKPPPMLDSEPAIVTYADAQRGSAAFQSPRRRRCDGATPLIFPNQADNPLAKKPMSA